MPKVHDVPPEPWRSFLADLDLALPEPVELHCCGGFVAIHVYGIARTTSDLDYLALIPNDRHKELLELAGRDSVLHKRHRVHLHAVTVAAYPEDYERRLLPLFPDAWEKIKLLALEAHDLALSKLERNFERDRDDIMRLARAGPIDAGTLTTRYRAELRPYLTRTSWHDKTLQMWIESYWS